MARNFLDENGLSYFWEKIKRYIIPLLNQKQDKGDYITADDLPMEVEVNNTGTLPTDDDVKLYANFTDDPDVIIKTVPEAPNDNKSYVRKYGSWHEAIGERTAQDGVKINNSKNVASAKDSLAVNYNTSASGEFSFAANESTSAKAHASSTFGENTVAENEAEHAVGVWNMSHSGNTAAAQTLDSIGIGTGVTHANAQETMRNGDLYISGIGGYDGTNPGSSITVQDIINDNAKEIVGSTDEINIK